MMREQSKVVIMIICDISYLYMCDNELNQKCDWVEIFIVLRGKLKLDNMDFFWNR